MVSQLRASRHNKTVSILMVGLCAVLWATVALADDLSGTVIDDACSPILINALVMEVNTAESYVIVGEKKFELTNYTIDYEKYKSTVVDAQGGVVNLKALKKDARVIASGFVLTDGRIVTEKITLTNSRK